MIFSSRGKSLTVSNGKRDINGIDIWDEKDGITTEGLIPQKPNYNTKIFSIKRQDSHIRGILIIQDQEIRNCKIEERI